MTKPSKLVLTGATGFLGHWLRKVLDQSSPQTRFDLLTAGRTSCDIPFDLDDPTSLAQEVLASRPDVVLHAAAMTSITDCESQPELADLRNHRATAALAHDFGPRLVFVSTDQVFDGKAAPYSSDAEPSPLNAYGRSKTLAEEAVQSNGGTVVRIPLLFGRSHDGQHGASDMLRRAPGSVVLFTNEFRTPLHVEDAARSLLEIVALKGAARSSRVFHLAGPERLSRFELGERLVQAVPELKGIVLTKARTADPLRPLDVSLEADFPCRRSFEQALADG